MSTSYTSDSGTRRSSPAVGFGLFGTKTVTRSSPVAVRVSRGASLATKPMEYAPPAVELDEDDAVVPGRASGQRLGHLSHAEVHRPDQRDEPESAFESAEQPLAEADRREVAQDGDDGADRHRRE
jgi:hypothetical protein